MKISDYKIRKFNPESRGELITTFSCSHYGFKGKARVYTCAGELEETHVVGALIKMIIELTDKEKYKRKITFYDSTVKEINEKTIKEFIDFEVNAAYKMYRDGF